MDRSWPVSLIKLFSRSTVFAGQTDDLLVAGAAKQFLAQFRRTCLK